MSSTKVCQYLKLNNYAPKHATMLNYAHIYLATIYAQNYAGIICQGQALV